MSEMIRYLKAATEIRDHFSRRATREEFEDSILALTPEIVEDVSGEKLESTKIVRKIVGYLLEFPHDWKVLIHSVYGGGPQPLSYLIEKMMEAALLSQEGYVLHTLTRKAEDEYFVIAIRGSLLAIFEKGVDDLQSDLKIALAKN